MTIIEIDIVQHLIQTDLCRLKYLKYIYIITQILIHA
jgi:hypothetical protein